jgi:hypothetical protein
MSVTWLSSSSLSWPGVVDNVGVAVIVDDAVGDVAQRH